MTTELGLRSLRGSTRTPGEMGHRKMVGGAIKLSYLVSELHLLKIFVIRFGEKVHAVNTFYVKSSNYTQIAI